MNACRWPLALFMTIALGASSLADDAIGYVAGLEGTAKVTRAGTTRELLLGETIFRDDSVFADAPASVRIDTRGGSIAICGRGRSAGDCRRTFDQGLPIAPAGSWWARGVAMVSSFRSTPTNLARMMAVTWVSAAPAGRRLRSASLASCWPAASGSR